MGVDELGKLQGNSFLLTSVLGNTSPQLDPPRLPSAANNSAEGWPIVIFCHGLFGSVEMYTQFCREVASTGAIVLALEHEDGTACYAQEADTGHLIPYVKTDSREPFLDKRVTEITSSVASIQATARAPPTGANSSEAALAAVLRQGDPGNMLLIGHSFGGSSMVRYARRVKNNPFRAFLFLDMWTEPLQEEDLACGIPVPFVMLLSGSWKREGAKRVMGSSAHSWGACQFPGTVHQWIAEVVYFLPHWVLRKFNMIGEMDQTAAFDLTVRVVSSVLKAFQSGSKESMLSEWSALEPKVLQIFDAQT